MATIQSLPMTNSMQYMMAVHDTHRKLSDAKGIDSKRVTARQRAPTDNFGSAPGKNPYFSKVHKKQRPLYNNASIGSLHDLQSSALSGIVTHCANSNRKHNADISYDAGRKAAGRSQNLVKNFVSQAHKVSIKDSSRGAPMLETAKRKMVRENNMNALRNKQIRDREVASMITSDAGEHRQQAEDLLE